MTALLVALGAAVGAPLRYLADQAVRSRYGGPFPWGTFAVNVLGSALLGFVVALPASGPVMAAVGTGFCGALTTYSTFGYDTVHLARSGLRLHALLNAVGSLVACLGAAWCGMTLAGSIT